MTLWNKHLGGRRPTTAAITIFTLVLIGATSCMRKSSPAPQTPPNSPTPTATLQSFPQQTGLVNDFANALDPVQEKNLDHSLTQLQRDVDVEFAVVTVDTTNGQSLFDYSLGLARAWKIGGEKGRGLLLVLAIKDHQWRLQITRALESDLPDDVCKDLAQPSLPLYHQGKYAEGIERYVRALGDRLKARRV
jgi:uncharacterized protein